MITTGTFGQRYQKLKQLGEGEHGRVWLALDTRTDEQVALKELHASRQADEEAVYRFKREAKGLARLRGAANIAQLVDCSVFESRETPYVAIEYTAGQTLQELIASRAE